MSPDHIPQELLQALAGETHSSRSSLEQVAISFSVADMAVLMGGLLLLAVLRCRRVALLLVGQLLGCTTRWPKSEKACIAEVTRLVKRCLLCKILARVRSHWVLSAAHAAGQCSRGAIPCIITGSTACACGMWLSTLQERVL